MAALQIFCSRKTSSGRCPAESQTAHHWPALLSAVHLSALSSGRQEDLGWAHLEGEDQLHRGPPCQEVPHCRHCRAGIHLQFFPFRADSDSPPRGQGRGISFKSFREILGQKDCSPVVPFYSSDRQDPLSLGLVGWGRSGNARFPQNVSGLRHQANLTILRYQSTVIAILSRVLRMSAQAVAKRMNLPLISLAVRTRVGRRCGNTPLAIWSLGYIRPLTTWFWSL